MKHPIRRRLMYMGFQGLRAVVQLLPWAMVQRLGRSLGIAAYGILRAHRRLAISHLTSAFGDAMNPAQRRWIAREAFCHLGQNAMEWFKLPRLPSTDLQRLVAVEGLQHLRGALAQGNGVVMVTGHFGNWELIPLSLKRLGFHGGVLARRLRYPEYESFLIDLRSAQGVPTLARGSLKEVARLLRANQIVGMLPDQDVDSLDGVFIEFFGRPTYTPLGPAALSLMTMAPILPCAILREGARFRLVIEPPIPIPRTEDRKQAMASLTQSWSRVIESYIRRYPDHWVWMHRRWKTQPSPARSTQHAADSRQSGSSAIGSLAPIPDALRLTQPCGSSRVAALVVCGLSLVAAIGGCAKSPGKPQQMVSSPGASAEPDGVQRMVGFSLTGYADTGAKRWTLDGVGASVEEQIVTIRQPDAVGFEPERTAHLTAAVAQINQTNRHVRMEHEVTVHTSDGLWFTAPVLHWIPDQELVATDTPVRIETDHMLLRGRGLHGRTQLKQATIFQDIELVLNPSDQDLTDHRGKEVTITCDGPLSFDYEKNIAIFEQNVHVKDPTGDLYADRLIAYLNQASHTIRYAEAIGRVRILQGDNTALSERAVYEPAVGKITLVGKPSLLLYPSGEHGPLPLSVGGLAEVAKPSAVAPAVTASHDPMEDGSSPP